MFWQMQNIKRQFPVLKQKINGHPLVYLDNAASTQKPESVISAIYDFYAHDYANIHRGLHELSQRASQKYEQARQKVSDFIGAKSEREIIFTAGTTAGINLIAHSWGQKFLQSGDTILLTQMEHHANIVPWQQLAKEKKLNIKYIEIDSEGLLQVDKIDQWLTSDVKLLSITHISNVLGTINPLLGIIKKAHQKNIPVLVDAAQSIAHVPIDVQSLDADWLVFSGHKMYGPTGIGVLYAKQTILESMPPFMTGGEMISEVDWQSATFNELPYKFEAGTPNIAGVIGLGAAIDFINSIGWKEIKKHESELSKYTLSSLRSINNLNILGPSDTAHHSGVFAFDIPGIHAHDMADILNSHGIAVRSGNHCAMPLHSLLKLAASTRASLALYNSREDIDVLAEAILEAKKVFGVK